MPAKNSSDRHLVASIAAHESWANTENRSARTAPGRAALAEKFLTEAGGDPYAQSTSRRLTSCAWR